MWWIQQELIIQLKPHFSCLSQTKQKCFSSSVTDDHRGRFFTLGRSWHFYSPHPWCFICNKDNHTSYVSNPEHMNFLELFRLWLHNVYGSAHNGMCRILGQGNKTVSTQSQHREKLLCVTSFLLILRHSVPFWIQIISTQVLSSSHIPNHQVS